MAKYSTKQRQLLVDYLSKHRDENLSAAQISEALSDKISKSAVYRNLSAMENEGKIRRVINNTREVVYQYTDSEQCKKCLHLTCKDCGRTSHMDIELADTLIGRVLDRESFLIDKKETVLYGLCDDCRKIKEKTV